MSEMKPKKKCVALRRCQARADNGRIDFFEAGDIGYFDEVPDNHFAEAENVGKRGVDFARVPENILRDDNIIPLEDVITYIKNASNEDLSGYERGPVVDYLMRLRNTPPELLGGNAKIAPTSQEFTTPAVDNEVGLTVELGESPADLGAETPEPAETESSDDGADDLAKLLGD